MMSMPSTPCCRPTGATTSVRSCDAKVPERPIFEIALSGFYKLSGVELSREQLEHALRGEGSVPPPYDISDEGLLHPAEVVTSPFSSKTELLASM